QKGAWVPWVLFMLEAVRATAVDASNKLKGITELQLKFGEKYRVRPDLAQLLFEKTYVLTGQVVEYARVSRITASTWLKDLEAQGALQSFKSGREVFFVNLELLSLLD
ncbi:MAG: hypothetical protein ACKOFA_00540, partial [Rhodoluna sp.]